MPSPRHRQRTLRRRRRAQYLVALAGLVAAGAGLFMAGVFDGDDDRTQTIADQTTPSASDAPAESTSTFAPGDATSSTASSSSSTSTTSSSSTSTTLAAQSGTLQGWYAVISSGPKDGTSRAGLEDAVDEHGDRGHVIDTDGYRTGDGLAPGYYPASGILAAVVGPFADFDATRSWCDAQGGTCHVRQLIPR